MSSFKVFSLVFRTLSKPVANALKQQAKSHDSFKNLCVNVAQVAHRTEMNWKMKVLGYKKEKIRPLNDARAVDAGANFLGETFIFTVAVSLIFAEQLRSRNQAQKQRNAVDDRLVALENEREEDKIVIEQLRQDCNILHSEVDEISKEVIALERVLMRIIGTDLERWSMKHGHKVPRVGDDLIERFENGENVDNALRDVIRVDNEIKEKE